MKMNNDRIVGRAELKLEEAAKAFGYDFRGKTVLDIGSSTGGFTEYALRNGAKKVIAVEKGTNQMKLPLRFDSRVELHEKTDIFETGTRAEKGAKLVIGIPEVVLADVSFVSLRKILEWARKNMPGKVDYLVMLKPQFEARPWQLVRGVVKNERMRRDVIRNFEQWLAWENFLIIKKRDNELTGKNGNRERFYWLRLAKG